MAIGAVNLLEYIKGKDDLLLAMIIRQGFSGDLSHPFVIGKAFTGTDQAVGQDYPLA